MWVSYCKTSAVPFTEFTERTNISFSDIQCDTDPSTEPSNLCLTKEYLPENKPIFYQKTSSISKSFTSLVPIYQSWTFILDHGFEK